MPPIDRLLDVRPLVTNPPFRRLWLGTALYTMGRQIALVATLFWVWELTESSFWVGFLGLVHAGPMIVFGLVGGAMADRSDRRRITLIATSAAMLLSALLAWQAALGSDALALVLLTVAAQVSCASLGAPSRKAIAPRLLKSGELPAGVALIRLCFQTSKLAGPLVAGALIASFGVVACYVVESVMLAAAIASLIGLPVLPNSKEPAARPTRMLEAIGEGFAYVRQRRLLSGSLAMDLASTLLAMPIALFPAINAARFGGAPETLGLFFSAMAAGGLLATVVSGVFTRIDDVGKAQIGASLLWGLAFVAAGLASDLALFLALLALAGVADTIAVISRATMLQLATDDAKRGRVSAFEMVAGAAGPQLGNVRAGWAAALAGPNAALIMGGGLCVLATLAIAKAAPELRAFQRSRAQ